MKRKIELSFMDLLKEFFNFTKKNIIQILIVSIVIHVCTGITILLMAELVMKKFHEDFFILILIALLFGTITILSIRGIISTGCSLSMVRQFRESGKASFKNLFRDTWKNKWRLIGTVFINSIFDMTIIIVMWMILNVIGVRSGFIMDAMLICLPFILLTSLIKSIVNMFIVYKGYKIIDSYKLALTIVFKVKGSFKYITLPIILITVIIQYLLPVIIGLNLIMRGALILNIISIYNLAMIGSIAGKVIDNIEV